MPTQKKVETVQELKGRFENATLVISAEYRGLTVKEMQDLRRKLRDGGLEVRVVKNTLVKLAAEDAGTPELFDIVEGPTALAITFGDVIDAAKAVAGYAGAAPMAFKVRGGYMEGSVLSADDLKELVKIPPRPVLIAQFMGQIQSPLAGFIGLLDAPLQEFAGLTQALLSELPGLLESRARQLEAA
jgi:large subunit ribosomal protein L10